LNHPSVENNYGFAIYGKNDFILKKSFSVEGTVFVTEVFDEASKTSLFLVHLPPPIFPDLWELQQKSLAWIVAEVKNINGQVIIAGDFNLTPWSFTFRKFQNQLSQKQISPVARIFLPSWPSGLPILAIDHVFTNMNLEIVKGDRGNSDHHSYEIQY
jgi:endonuclease/exonuclease/phosphatase (EEP) superfamily protein YafD